MDSREEGPPEGIASIQHALSSIDCTESQDTGYNSGAPFTITVVTVDGYKVEKATANAYYVMAQAAAAAGVGLEVVSGFRTMAEQSYFYDCYINCGSGCSSCNLAAAPGYSNHQSGHALDLNTLASGVLSWLNANGGTYGFARTVASEDWHWEWWGGGPGGGPCGEPQGYLDSVDCSMIKGWAQDPDVKTSAIDVHIYFDGPAGAPGAKGFATKADKSRPDLCAPLGSCEHAFELPVPAELIDGKPHSVYAYAIDAGGGNNPQLTLSPKSITCNPVPPASDAGVVVADTGVVVASDAGAAVGDDLPPVARDDASSEANGKDRPVEGCDCAVDPAPRTDAALVLLALVALIARGRRRRSFRRLPRPRDQPEERL